MSVHYSDYVVSDFLVLSPTDSNQRPWTTGLVIDWFTAGLSSKELEIWASWTVCFVFPLQEVEEFVNGSGEHGFVVFTLGSMVSNMPEKHAQEFFKAFRQIPQRVRDISWFDLPVLIVLALPTVVVKTFGNICFLIHLYWNVIDQIEMNDNQTVSVFFSEKDYYFFVLFLYFLYCIPNIPPRFCGGTLGLFLRMPQRMSNSWNGCRKMTF